MTEHRQVTIKEADNGYIVQCYKGDGESEEMIAKDMPEAQKMLIKMFNSKKAKAKDKPKGGKGKGPSLAALY